MNVIPLNVNTYDIHIEVYIPDTAKRVRKLQYSAVDCHTVMRDTSAFTLNMVSSRVAE
ncbi:hypothetical protein GCM10011328_03220 [Hafnia psychrotolerans]|uniref:Uncharacterized protein n=1 Tax=Hafnia psychrotolerans TaxID=1477018 RepID=A0ABQ1FWN9_9GAMM|nr:hypothetical protein GCM10011328_03220 [Hafnia psychrotolerans]